MTLKVLLSGNGPGYGTITLTGGTITGSDPSPKTVGIAIQRNRDDKYLGQNQYWHTTPHWHPLERVEQEGDELHLRVGPEIIDGVVAVSNMPLQVWVRVDEIEDQGVLRIKGQLLGSHAASEVTPEITVVDEAIERRENEVERQQREAEARRLEREHREREEEDAAELRRHVEIRARSERRGRLLRTLILVLLVFLLLGGGAAAWKLGWFVDVPQEAEPEPLLRGRKFVQAYLNRDPKPTPHDLFAKAQERENDQDCEAAMILYNRAADTDVDLAMVLAQRYDPDTFQSGHCVESADADTASHWYENPARAGNTDAQRQLGKILTSQYASGAIHERGIEWLRQAAETGDAEAKALLAERTH